MRFTRNIGTIIMDLDGIERMHVHTLGGADTIIVNDLAGTDLETVDVDLAAFDGSGDGQPDTVIVERHRRRRRVIRHVAGDGSPLVDGLAARRARRAAARRRTTS